MADRKNMLLGVICLLTLGVSYLLGSFVAKQSMAFQKEEAVIQSGQRVVKEPNSFAERVDFSIDRKEMPLIIEKLDYQKANKGKPNLVYIKNDKTAVDDTTKKQYKLPGGHFYRVISWPEGNNLKLEVKTDKNDIVQLTVPKVDVTVVDEGLWQRVKFKDGNTGWIMK